MKIPFSILVFSLLISCTNSRKNDCYEIYNAVLKEKISTYGILHQYISFRNNPSEKELNLEHERIIDSLKNSKSLTYFLDHKLSILDTLNPADEFFVKRPILVESRPTYSKNKIDFSKIKNLEIARRLEDPTEIDENEKNPTYLGSYDLSEPVFISKEKVIIRYQHYCGSKCGLGLLLYLKKANGEWKIVEEKMIWIS